MAENDEGRKREDRSGGNRFSCRCDGLHEIILEDGGPAGHPQQRHRDNGGRDAGRYGQAGVKAKICIGSAEDQGEGDPQRDGAGGQFAGGELR